MATFYLDASALLKRYRTERGTDVLNEIFDRYLPDDTLVTSHLTLLELEASLSRALRARLLPQDVYDALMRHLSSEAGIVFALSPLNGQTIRRAVFVTRVHGLPAGDAIHLATALELATPDRAIVLVTSDRELLAAASREQQLIAVDPQAPNAIEQIQTLRQ